MGFVMVPEWLMLKRPKGNDILVYINLARHGSWNPASGAYEDCVPQIQTIADEMGVSHDTIERAIARLVALGGVVRVKRRLPDGTPTSNAYRVIFGAVVEPKAPDSPPVKKPPQKGRELVKPVDSGTDTRCAPKAVQVPSQGARDGAGRIIFELRREGVTVLSGEDEVKLSRRISEALDRGWHVDLIFEQVRQPVVGAGSAVAVLISRVTKRFAGHAPVASQAKPKCPIHPSYHASNCGGCKVDKALENRQSS